MAINLVVQGCSIYNTSFPVKLAGGIKRDLSSIPNDQQLKPLTKGNFLIGIEHFVETAHKGARIQAPKHNYTVLVFPESTKGLQELFEIAPIGLIALACTSPNKKVSHEVLEKSGVTNADVTPSILNQIGTKLSNAEKQLKERTKFFYDIQPENEKNIDMAELQASTSLEEEMLLT
ncbi:MAG: hypothetical protein RLZZ210_1158 [Pseudomonadota bacterium]|jgi:hypothetical protein